MKYKRKRYDFAVTNALELANVSTKEFLKCWQFVRPRTPPDEVFSWFKDAGFRQGSTKVSLRVPAVSLKVVFVRKILQRYKEIIEVFGVYIYLLFLIFVFVVRFLCT